MNAKADAENNYSYISTGRLPAEAEVISLIDERIARLLQSFERIYCGPAGATDLYTKQYALNVSARDLAVMGATLADGSVNPITKVRVVDPAVFHDALAVHVQPGTVGLQLSEILPAPIVAGLQNKTTRDTP